MRIKVYFYIDFPQIFIFFIFPKLHIKKSAFAANVAVYLLRDYFVNLQQFNLFICFDRYLHIPLHSSTLISFRGYRYDKSIVAIDIVQWHI